MNSKLTQAALYSRLDKSIAELLEVLGEIDENDAANADNEWSIGDNNGGRIQLSLQPKNQRFNCKQRPFKHYYKGRLVHIRRQ